jgi:hypothetical protein
LGSGDPAVIVPAGALGVARFEARQGVSAARYRGSITAMTLARAWRRQLYGASSVALIVPSAMLAALVVLALGGGFSQVGVLGQIFAGPPAPGASDATAGGHAGVAVRALPAIPAVAVAASRPGTGRRAGAGRRTGGGHRSGAPAPLGGPRQTGGALTPVRGTAPIVGAAPRPSAPAPTGTAPTGSAPTQPPPQPGPSRQPTGVDRIVQTITPVTQALPAPAGPVATQAVQSAAGAADSVLPPPAGSGAGELALK